MTIDDFKNNPERYIRLTKEATHYSKDFVDNFDGDLQGLLDCVGDNIRQNEEDGGDFIDYDGVIEDYKKAGGW